MTGRPLSLGFLGSEVAKLHNIFQQLFNEPLLTSVQVSLAWTHFMMFGFL